MMPRPFETPNMVSRKRISAAANDNPAKKVRWQSSALKSTKPSSHQAEAEAQIRRGLIETCKNPRRGSFVLLGDKGVGKTAMASRVLRTMCTDRAANPKLKWRILVFWISCCKWQEECFTYDVKVAFEKEVIEVVRKYDSSFSSSLPSKIIQFFKYKGQHVLFVFDDVCSVGLIRHFAKVMGKMSCCVITSAESFHSKEANSVVRGIVKLDRLVDGEMKAMLDSVYGLKDRLSHIQLKMIANVTEGLALPLHLLCNRMFSQCLVSKSGNNSAVSHQLRALEKVERSLIVHNLLGSCSTNIPDEIFPYFFAFLFFEPDEAVSLRDLAVFWNSPNPTAVVDRLKAATLVSPFRWPDENFPRLVVHCLLFEDYIKRISNEWNLGGDRGYRLETIRVRLLKQQLKSKDNNPIVEMLMFEAVRQKCLLLCQRFVEVFSATSLMNLCKEHSAKSEDEMYSSFLHFLYQKGNGSSDSCKTLMDIIQKLKRGHVPPTEILEILNCKPLQTGAWRTLLTDILADEAPPYRQTYQKLRLIEECKQWKNVRDKQLWMNTVLTNNNIDPLVRAIVNNDKDGFQLQIAHGDAYDEMRIVDTASAASYFGRTEFLSAIHLEFGERAISSVDSTGKRPAEYASENGYLEIIKFVSEISKDLLARDGVYGRTPLMLAASHGHLNVVKFISEFDGQLLRQTDYEGRTPIMYASGYGHLNIVKLIIDIDNTALSQRDHIGNNAVFFASENGHLDVVYFLAQRNRALLSESATDNMRPIMLAAQNGHLDVVRLILQFDPSQIFQKDSYGRIALMLASGNGHLEVVRYLIDFNGAVLSKVDKIGATALMYAAENGHVEVVRLLSDKNPRLLSRRNDRQMTAAMVASECGQVNVLKLLAELDVNLLTARGIGNTSVGSFAASQGHVQVVQYLVKVNKALCFESDLQGMTLSMRAAETGHLQVVEFLVSLDKDELLRRNVSGSTVILEAARKNHLDIVEYCAKFDEIVILQCDNQGITALMYAARFGYTGLLEFAVETDIRTVTQTDNRGMSALSYASQAGRFDVCEYFIRNGANVDEIGDGGGTLLIRAVSAGSFDRNAVEDRSIVMALLDKCSEATINHVDNCNRNAAKFAFDTYYFAIRNGNDLHYTEERFNVCLAMLRAGGKLSLDPFENRYFDFPLTSVANPLFRRHYDSLLATTLELRGKNSFNWKRLVSEILHLNLDDIDDALLGLPQYYGLRVLRGMFPRPLQAACRMALLRQLPKGLTARKQAIDMLHLPISLQKYLNFEDLENCRLMWNTKTTVAD